MCKIDWGSSENFGTSYAKRLFYMQMNHSLGYFKKCSLGIDISKFFIWNSYLAQIPDFLGKIQHTFLIGETP